MFNKKCGLVLLTLLLLLVSVSSVCAADNNTGSLTTVKDNDSVYGCGVVAFQTALEYNDVNISLEEAEKATNTVNGSTSMQGLIDGAEKYNLSAVGAVIKAEDLKTGYIVHMNIDNTGHWAVIENITEYVNLNDISDDLILPLDEFKKYYTNKTVIISNETKCLSSFGGESNVYGSSKTFHRNVKPKKKVISTSINARLNKYVTKYKKGYKIQSHKFKVYSYQQVSIFVYKKGHMLKNSRYAMKVRYKHCGKWKWTKWVSNCISATYNNIKFEKSDVIGKVHIRIY